MPELEDPTSSPGDRWLPGIAWEASQLTLEGYMSHRRTTLGLVVVLAAVALFAVPLTATADASKRSEKRQNTALRRLRRADRRRKKALQKVQKDTKSLTKAVNDLKTSTAQVANTLTGALNQVKA